MSTAPAVIELRPMGIGDILDGTFRLYKARFLQFFVIALVAYIPYAISSGVIDANFAPTRAPIQPGVESPYVPTADYAESADELSIEYFLLNALGTLIFFSLVMPLVQGALIFNISAAVLGERQSAGTSYGRAAGRLGPLLGTQFLVMIVIYIGILLLVVPGIIFSLWFMLTAVIVMLEHRAGTRAMGRSRELMRGNLGKGFLLGLTLALLGWIIVFGATFVFKYIPWPFFVNRIALLLVQAAVLPIQMAPLILFYYELRVRKEAFDLERLAEATGMTARPVKAV